MAALVDDAHRQQRLEFARANINRDWNKVLFSDVKMFRFDDHFATGIWGWMSLAGPGLMCAIGSRYSSVQYTELLEQVLIPTVDIIHPGETMIFMQDNQPVHNSRFTREWFNNHTGIQVLQNWPHNSHDLNPMEDLWDEVTHGWEYVFPRTVNNVEAYVVEKWDQMRGVTGYFDNLYGGMSRRIQNIINSNGGPAF